MTITIGKHTYDLIMDEYDKTAATQGDELVIKVYRDGVWECTYFQGEPHYYVTFMALPHSKELAKWCQKIIDNRAFL